MTRQYKNILYSRQLSRQECKNCLDEITIEIDKAEKSGTGSFTMMTPFYTCENCVAKYFFAMNMTSIWNLISPMK